jgi:DNA-binding beta-propeller fold protein YncE
VTEYGALWVADRERDRVIVLDNQGRFESFIGDFGYTGGQLSSPEKVVAMPGGAGFVVCDAGNGRLVFYDGYGNFQSELAHEKFEYPIAAAAEPAGDLWVLDGVSGRLFFVDATATVLFETGPRLPGNDRALKGPSDIVRLADGRLLISDTGNNRLLVCRVILEE